MSEQEIRLTVADYCESEDVEGLSAYLNCSEAEAIEAIAAYKKYWGFKFPDRPKSLR